MSFSSLVIAIISVSFMCIDKRHEVDAQSTCDQKGCVRCDLETTQCMKCLNVMDETTRKCLKTCPAGLDPTWSRLASVHGQVCSGRSLLSMVSDKEVSIIAGASVGGAVCIGILLGFLLLRRKESKTPPDSPIIKVIPRMAQDKRPKAEEMSVKGREREEFLSKIKPLRSEAPCILRMMAETRARFRGFTGPDAASDTKAKACRAVVRDLSRVLSLVSQKEENIQSAPKDWRRLLSWTERLLIRYKRQQTTKFTDGKASAVGQERAGLFVTRQEKALQERRIRNYSPCNSLDQMEDHTSIVIQPVVKDTYDLMTSVYKVQMEHDLQQISAAKTSTSNQESIKKKKKDTIKLNLSLLNKILSPKEPPESPTQDTDRCDHLNVDQRSDYIQSQTFFDHIEAFAFDMDEQFAQVSESPKSQSKVGQNDSNNNEPSSQKSLTHSSPNELHFEEIALKKAKKRPGKLKRISSSLLMKRRWDNYTRGSVSGMANKRRPLTRQKQVEKNQKDSIHNKYLRNKDSCSSHDFNSSHATNETRPHEIAPNIINCSSRNTPYDQVVDSTFIEQKLSESTSLNEIIQGNDMYVKVTRTPVYHHPIVSEKISRIASSNLGKDNLNTLYDILVAV